MSSVTTILSPAIMVCAAAPFTDPSDGKVMQLRQCASFADTLRGRDNNALFPLEKYDFIKNVRALAAAFDDHDKPLLFVELFDTLHLHWGSAAQPKDVCDPTAPRSNARWCSQDGASSYEPLLVDVLRKTDLFKALQDTIPVLEDLKIPRCELTDAKTGRCLKLGATRSGLEVLAAVRVEPVYGDGLVEQSQGETRDASGVARVLVAGLGQYAEVEFQLRQLAVEIQRRVAQIHAG